MPSLHTILPSLLLTTFLPAFTCFADHPGRAVYERSCAICHQSDGTGWREKNGPTLIHSEWVTGDADRLARITLGGLYQRIPLKNSTHYGVMPGLKDILNDQEIADALTYIRQAWGHQASPIESSNIARLRREANERPMPWTAQEFGLEVKNKLGPNGEALMPSDPFAAQGFKVYQMLCQNCHQPNGRGIVTSDGHGYPPLDGSEWVSGSPDRLVRIVLGGLQGKITVKGQPANDVMPPWGVMLSDDQTAQVLTFVRQAWTNQSPPVSPGLVRTLRPEIAKRAGNPWTLEDLNQAK